jgi:hypothetical protein
MLVEAVDEFRPAVADRNLAAPSGALEPVEVLAAKDLGERLHREEEPGPGREPSP